MERLGPNSRYRQTFKVRDEVRKLSYILLGKSRVFFDPEADNRIYKGQSGENLFAVAARHFRGYPRPASMFFVLAHYQPTPILDPTTDLGGRDIHIPPAEKVAAILRLDETAG